MGLTMKMLDSGTVCFRRLLLLRAAACLASICLTGPGCTKSPKETSQPAPQLSTIKVEVRPNGPLVVTTSTAEFQVLPSGYVQAFLVVKGSNRLTLDESQEDSGYMVQGNKKIRFAPNFDQAKVTEASGKLGRGKRVEIPSHPLGPATGVQRTLVIEAYDNFPNLLLTSTDYKNAGASDFQIDQVVEQQHRFNASLADPQAQPYEMWSYQGSSYDWGKDDVLKLKPSFSQPNVMGKIVKGGYGGGIPVVAFWTGSVGEAIGHVETLPLVVSLPTKVESDKRVSAALSIPASTVLKNGSQERRHLFHAAQLRRSLCGRLLPAVASVVERIAKRRMGNHQALRRGLQRELVRMGVRVQRHPSANAGDRAKAEGARHQVGHAG